MFTESLQAAGARVEQETREEPEAGPPVGRWRGEEGPPRRSPESKGAVGRRGQRAADRGMGAFPHLPPLTVFPDLLDSLRCGMFRQRARGAGSRGGCGVWEGRSRGGPQAWPEPRKWPFPAPRESSGAASWWGSPGVGVSITRGASES